MKRTEQERNEKEIIVKEKVKSYEEYTHNIHTLRIHNTYSSKNEPTNIKNQKYLR